MSSAGRKVLFLIDTLEVGGAERSMLDILSRFREFEPIMCYLYSGGTLTQKYRDAGIRVVALNTPGKYSFFRAIASVRRLIREEKPSLVISTLFRSDVVGRIATCLECVPVVSTFVNDTYAPVRWQSMRGIRKSKHVLLWLLDRATSGLVHVFISNSESIKRGNCRSLGISADRVSVIYRGRSMAIFRPPEESATRKVSGGVLLNVARLEQRKGQAELLLAMPTVLRAHPDVRLHIVGEGPYRPVLESMIAELHLTDKVLLLGTRHDVPDLLRGADVFVSPSHYEGLPGAVVEAMLTALPIVVSGIDVHREMIVEGDNGRLFEMGDPQALATVLIDLLDRPVEAHLMGVRARQRAMQLFEIDEVVRRHETLYGRILADWSSR